MVYETGTSDKVYNQLAKEGIDMVKEWKGQVV